MRAALQPFFLRGASASVLALIALVPAAPALAQIPGSDDFGARRESGVNGTLGPGEGVMDRARPDYDPKGLDLGGLRLRPAIDMRVGYDDNVLRQPAPARKSSAIYTERPSFSLISDWGRHMLEAFGQLVATQYDALTSENHVDWTAGGRGRLDIYRGTSLAGTGSYSTLHEARNSPDQPGNAAKPTEYGLTHADGVFTYQPYLLGVSFGANYDRFAYRPTAIIAGAPLSNRDRDHDETSLWGRVQYEVSPGANVFVRGDYVQHDFDLSADRSGVNRDSHGMRATAGLSLDLTHLLRGEVFAGYLDQRYHAPLRNVSGISYGAALDWYATELITVRLSGTRVLADTVLAGASTDDTRTVALGIDYEFLRNLIVRTNLSYADETFKGITRHDAQKGAGVGLIWLINRYLSANVRYDYQMRSSTDPTQRYDDNLATAGLTLHL